MCIKFKTIFNQELNLYWIRRKETLDLEKKKRSKILINFSSKIEEAVKQDFRFWVLLISQIKNIK